MENHEGTFFSQIQKRLKPEHRCYNYINKCIYICIYNYIYVYIIIHMVIPRTMLTSVPEVIHGLDFFRRDGEKNPWGDLGKMIIHGKFMDHSWRIHWKSMEKTI